MNVNFINHINQRSFMSHIVLNSIGHSDFFNKFRDEAGKPTFDSKNLDIKLTINGIEIPVEQGFKAIGEQFESEVKEAAQKLVEEKLFKIDERIEEFRSLQEQLNNKFREIFGLQPEEKY